MADVETRTELWGDETRKAIGNFTVSGEPIPASVAHWLGRIKGAAARVNAELGLLDADKAERIAAAADRVASGELDDQFPIDVFQTGSGTSSNMNANEVLATLAGDDVHPNDDVNMGQSSNDVFPSAVHLAALEQLTQQLIPALEQLANSLGRKSQEFDDIVKSGRTHLMDAVPVTLGQEFSGYATQVRQGADRVRVPSGLRGEGLIRRNRPEHAPGVRRARPPPARRRDRAHDQPAGGPVRSPGRPRLARGSLRGPEDGRGVADEDRQRPAPDGVRPARGVARSCRARSTPSSRRW